MRNQGYREADQSNIRIHHFLELLSAVVQVMSSREMDAPFQRGGDAGLQSFDYSSLPDMPDVWLFLKIDASYTPSPGIIPFYRQKSANKTELAGDIYNCRYSTGVGFISPP